MAKLGGVVCLVLVCVLVVAIAPPRAEAITCGQVAGYLSPCIRYVTGKGPLLPGCCDGIKALKNAAKTTADRRATCACLKALAARFNANLGIIAGLPGKCGVSVGYPIRPNTDCSKVN